MLSSSENVEEHNVKTHCVEIRWNSYGRHVVEIVYFSQGCVVNTSNSISFLQLIQCSYLIAYLPDHTHKSSNIRMGKHHSFWKSCCSGRVQDKSHRFLWINADRSEIFVVVQRLSHTSRKTLLIEKCPKIKLTP